MTEDSLIKALKNDDKSTLKSIYLDNKTAFIAFANKYDLSNEDILDVYQDAIIALRENALKGHLNDMKSGLKTYLFSIGKYMIYKRLKDQKKMRTIDDGFELGDAYDEPVIKDIDYEFSPMQRQLQTAFKQLGKQCQKVLTLFYFRGFTLDEIVVALDYQKKDVVKSQKSRCIKTLKKIIGNN